MELNCIIFQKNYAGEDIYATTREKEEEWEKVPFRVYFIDFKKSIVVELEDKLQTGRKYLQRTHLIKDCHPKYAKSS